LVTGLKISMIGPVYPYRGGIAHYTGHLAHALLAEGHSTQVISFRRQYPAWLYPGASDRDPSKMPLHTPAEYLLDPLYPWTWAQAARKIAAGKPDLVIIHWWTTFWGAPYALLAGRLRQKGLRLIYVIHNVLPHEKRPWDAWLAKQALRQGHVFIAQTGREKDRLLDLLPQAQVEIHPHPVYGRFGDEPVTKEEARRRLAFPKEGALLLFFGIVRPYKGLAHLLEALGLLKARGLSPCLVIAGEFWEPKEGYLSQVKRLGIASQVRIEDRYLPNEQAHLLFTAADALVAPYTGGTQSGAASLGLGYHLPLIVSDQVALGIPEANQEVVQVVQSGDAAALAEAIEAFLARPSGQQAPALLPVEDEWQALARALVKLA
jgi:glycosyltransferase involved in cell wall biosynthesis